MPSKTAMSSAWRAIARINFDGLPFAGTAKLLKARQGNVRQAKARASYW